NFRVTRPGAGVRLYVSSWNNLDTTNGVLTSLDNGATWATINAGMGHRYVNSFDQVGEQIVRASTLGGGVFNFASGPVPQQLTVTSTVGGVITSSPPGISCSYSQPGVIANGATCSAVFNPGEVVSLNVITSSGFAFSNWG